MKFYNTSRSLCLETDALGVGLGARLLQVRYGMNCWCDEVLDNTTLCPITFASKILPRTEQHYSDIEHEAMVILQGMENFNHYFC